MVYASFFLRGDNSAKVFVDGLIKKSGGLISFIELRLKFQSKFGFFCPVVYSIQVWQTTETFLTRDPYKLEKGMISIIS